MEKTLIQIPINGMVLEGSLVLPKQPFGIVLFAHGSGSSRFSPRNRFVAGILNKQNIATLLVDLLSKEEDEVYESRFDIDLLTMRLAVVAKWLLSNPKTKQLPLGVFGASTGAAGALRIAAIIPKKVCAVVSRGGRPDLAGNALADVKSPTLLIVGGRDLDVLELNQSACERLTCTKKLYIVEGATHLFEESGALEEVAKLAVDWFTKYFAEYKKAKL